MIPQGIPVGAGQPMGGGMGGMGGMGAMGGGMGNMNSMMGLMQGAQAASTYWSSFTQKTEMIRGQVGFCFVWVLADPCPQASRLRYYFDVTNDYVLNKLKLVLFPFRHQVWTTIEFLDFLILVFFL